MAQQGPALPSPTPAGGAKTPYQEAIEEAVSEFGAAHWDEAYVSFKRANELQPGPRPMRGMGKALYERRSYAEAVHILQQALDIKDSPRPLNADQRADVEKWLAKARMYIAEVHLVIKPADAALFINGTQTQQRAFILNSGSYQLMATHPDYKELRQDLRVTLGQKQTINLIMETKTPVVAAVVPPPAVPAPAPPVEPQAPQPQEVPAPVAEAQPEPAAQPAPAPEPADDGPGTAYTVTSWLFFGAGVVLLGTGGVMAALNAADFVKLDEKCQAGECTDDDLKAVDEGIDASNLSNGLMFAGGGALAVAVGMWIFAPGGGDGGESASLEVLPACNGMECGVVARGTF